MENLKKLLQDLGQDAELEKAFEKDPDAVIGQYKLSDDAAAALKRGDVDAVRELSGLDDVHMINSTIKAYR